MKIVLITQRVDNIEKYNERRDALDQNWSKLMMKCNLLCIPVPNNAELVKKILETNIKIEGIILTGGNSPREYGGDSKERDDVDNLLIEYSLKQNIPLLGVCRGMQSILIYFGSTLKKVKNHIAIYHDIDEKLNRKVNSFHQLGCDEIAECLQVLAKSSDGVIEKITHKCFPIYGIMWHPERFNPFTKEDLDYIIKIFYGDGDKYESNYSCSWKRK